MPTPTSLRLGPEFTPSLIRHLIFITCGISLFSALLEPLLHILFGLPGLSSLLALSKQGLQHYYLWQIVSYLFLEDTHGLGISLSFLLTLAFNMYLLWVLGSDLLARIGQAAFLRLYLLSGIFAGLVAIAAMVFTGREDSLSGAAPAILATVTAWTLFNPETYLFFFFLFPIKAKWLWSALVGSLILISLSQLDWVYLAFYSSAILFGYFYCLIAWDQQGPFTWTRPLDNLLSRRPKTKIFDFKTGEPLLDDNQFVDAMLEKISKQGESALTWKERQRLQQISAKKR